MNPDTSIAVVRDGVVCMFASAADFDASGIPEWWPSEDSDDDEPLCSCDENSPACQVGWEPGEAS